MIQVLKFYADWCGPCKILKNVIDQLKEDFKDVEFIDVNIEEQQDYVAQHGVMSVPTVLIFKNGEEIARKVGIQSRSVYEQFLV
jgi:thioredoxin 1